MPKPYAAGVFAVRPVAVALAVAFVPLQPSLAQTTNPDPAEAGKLQAVTVTAERVSENIKDVPSSVFTLGGEKLDILNSGGQDVRLLSARVPSLNIESSFGRAFPRFYIRGYGNTDFRVNASQPVSLIYDDVVQENPLLKGFPIFDLDRIEVLTGPQGTLFGRNTPAGVVKFDSAKPLLGRSEGYGSVSYGTYGTATGEGAVNIPLGAEWAARVSALYQRRDDWVDNTYDAGPTQEMEGYDDGAARVQLLYKPSASFSALGNLHTRHMTGSARLFRANIFKPGTNDFVDDFEPDEISTDGRNEQRIETSGGNLRLRYDFDRYSLHSITGYETAHTFSRGDIDGGFGAVFAPPSGPGFIPFPSETAGALRDHRQLTQELRIESRYTGPLNWQSGVYYFDEKFTADSYSYDSLGGGAQTSLLTDVQENKSWAVFGSLKYAFTPAFEMRGGLRYTQDKKDLVSNADGTGIDTSNGSTAHLDDSKVSGDLSGSYKLTPDTNVFARVANGYRGSSVQPASLFGPQSIAGQEDVISYEAGVKADLFDRRARLSFSAFHYTVTDLQLTEVGGGGNSNTLLSADKAVGKGLELSLDAYLTENLLVTLSGSVNDTEIQDPDLAVSGCGGGCTVTDPSDGAGRFLIDGNALPQAPKYVANITARYGIPTADGGEWYVYTDWAYRSKINFFLYESKEFTGKSLVEGGLRIGRIWDNGKYEVALFGRNITNKIVAVGGIDFNNLTGFINEPRMWGAQFRATF